MSLKILIVEDNETILFLLEQFLTELGYRVFAYPDPIEASDFCRCFGGDSCADIIITDNHMPRCSGLDYLEGLLKKGCTGRERHMAIASGHWSMEEFKRATELGCKIFQKPYHLHEIRHWIEKCRESIPGNKKAKEDIVKL